MINVIFIITIAAILTIIYWFGFVHFPKKNWQFLAAVPIKNSSSNKWNGINFTYYGLLSSTGYIIAIVLYIILLKAANYNYIEIFSVMLMILLFCMPAS